MNEDLEKSDNQEEKEKLTCPECGKGFQDMRGLTSHARNKHGLNRDKLIETLNNNQEKLGWKLIAGIGSLVLTLITLGKTK